MSKASNHTLIGTSTIDGISADIYLVNHNQFYGRNKTDNTKLGFIKNSKLRKAGIRSATNRLCYSKDGYKAISKSDLIREK